MPLYCIGDIQGCQESFEKLLRSADFSPSRDTLYVLGDLVNRGPDSLQVLRTCMQADGAILSLLGNHDLHLLAAAHGARRAGRRDTLAQVLEAPDRSALLGWLARQPLARRHVTARGEALLMVHAGVLPQWSAEQALGLADEVHAVLASTRLEEFLHSMYGNLPNRWSDDLQGMERLRCIVNALTRLRFCTEQGTMDFDSTESAEQAPPGLMPWFEVPGRATAQQTIAFGHWSTLGHLDRPHLLGMDTGCVWGGCLSMVRFGANLNERELLQVRCPQAQQPG